jgi:phosphoribosylformylglycinamidine synthase
MNLLQSGFPQWEFEAEWTPPGQRKLAEPAVDAPDDYGRLIKDLLARPNICSTEWIIRQYDHEVQGTSVIKPLVGAERDINSDATVIRPVLPSLKGLAFTQALLPAYSAIDAYHMASCSIDEAVRRLVAVGAELDHIGGVDNFCWPNIQYHPTDNPDGKLKAAQLVRACWSLRDVCQAYEIPLLSGKDSMYVDGYLSDPSGKMHKVSALETLQFSAVSVINDIRRCVSMDSKFPGDLVYILGVTRNELGASEYYAHLGEVGLNVPQVRTEAFLAVYRKLSQSIAQENIASAHGIYRGGLGVHLAMVAMGGNLGMQIELDPLPVEGVDRDDSVMFSESAGRFIVTIDPNRRQVFEKLFKGTACACIGTVTATPQFEVKGLDQNIILSVPVSELKAAWKKPFGDLI